MGMHDEMAVAEGPTAAAADIDLPEHTANDIFLLEEEVEVERYLPCLLHGSHENNKYGLASQCWTFETVLVRTLTATCTVRYG